MWIHDLSSCSFMTVIMRLHILFKARNERQRATTHVNEIVLSSLAILLGDHEIITTSKTDFSWKFYNQVV